MFIFERASSLGEPAGRAKKRPNVNVREKVSSLKHRSSPCIASRPPPANLACLHVGRLVIPWHTSFLGFMIKEHLHVVLQFGTKNALILLLEVVFGNLHIFRLDNQLASGLHL